MRFYLSIKTLVYSFIIIILVVCNNYCVKVLKILNSEIGHTYNQRYCEYTTKITSMLNL